MAERYKGVYEINGVRWKRFDLDLIKAARDLHQAAHGPSDLGLFEQRNCLGFIRARVDDWVDSQPGCEFFDEAVFNMCKASVMEFQTKWPGCTADVKILDKDTE